MKFYLRAASLLPGIIYLIPGAWCLVPGTTQDQNFIFHNDLRMTIRSFENAKSTVKVIDASFIEFNRFMIGHSHPHIPTLTLQRDLQDNTPKS